MRVRTFVGWLLLLALCACDAPGGKSSPVSATDKDALFVLNRTDYIDPTLYAAFTRETGIKIFEVTYDDDTELLAQLKAPAAHFDVLIASDRNVAALRRDNKLAALNLNNVANFQNLEARLKNLPFDPNNQVSAPYVWGTVGLLYRTDKLPTVDSWNVLFDPSRNAGKVAVLEEPRMGLGAALKWLGLSLNSASAAELARA